MKIILQALFLIGFSLIGYTQVSISGTITDHENNPLFGVDIYAPNNHIATTSNINGNYEFYNLPHGEITIIFSYVGFKSAQKIINIHEDRSGFNIVLEEAIFHIDEVIISTPFNRLQSQNVMKVELATVKEIKKKGAITLIEGLETVPGVTQISTGSSIGKPVIRGLSGNRVLVYAQGVRLENQQFGDEHGLGLNQAGIESVEVIKGPASLLYGSDALGGVLYFNPEKFAATNSFKSDFGQQYYSNTQGINTNFGLKQSYDHWKYLIRAAYDTHVDYKIPNKNRVTNTRYNELNINTGLGYNSKFVSSELRYNYNHLNVGLTEGIHEQSTSRTLENPYQKINNHILSLHNHIYFDTSKLDVDLGYIFNDRNEFEDEHGHPSTGTEELPALRMKLKTFNYDLKYHFPKFNTIELIGGLQGMSQTNRNLGEEMLIPNANINDVGTFATAIIDFENSALMAGLRFDYRKIETEYHEVHHDHEIHVFEALDKNYNSFTASAGYKFNLSEKITTRLNLASGFRSPNLAELTSNGIHHGTNRFEKGDPNLEKEQNFQTDVSFEYKNDHFNFYINGFYNVLNNYIYINPTGAVEDGAPVYKYIQENADLYGGEIGVHLHPHPLDWLHLESSFETVTGKQNNGNYLPLIPANKWNNSVRTEFKINNWLQNGYTSINTISTFSQSNVSNFETPTSSYTLLNLGVGGQINLSNITFNLTANLNNALNKSYISHLSRLKVYDIDNIGRNFILGINFNL
ncbi:MAG: TonB-dependent receptor [Flavobacteriaceae bacterium]|nr:TonB-dependent receptor [Flavobacteriaceae bacterium]